MSETCRICMEDNKISPLVKRCTCSSGYFHDECFIKWISHRSSCSCEVCNERFQGALVQIGAIRTYSSISFKYFYIVSLSLPIISIIFWIYIKFFSDLVYCVHHYHASYCGEYRFFRTCVISINILFTISLIIGINIFKNKTEHFGIFIDAPISRILLTHPHSTFRQTSPQHPELRANETITIHHDSWVSDISYDIIDTALANPNDDTIVSVEDEEEEEQEQEEEQEEEEVTF